MELLQLAYFLEVAESEHVTNSARKLHVAQPALTQSIRRLERELGVTLFEHVGRNIRLTPAGAYVKERVAPALASLEHLQRDLDTFSAEERHTVRIDIQSASGLVIDAIARYSAEHPHARFSVSQSDREPFCDLRVTTLMPDGSFHGFGPADAIGEPEALFTERIGLAVPERDRTDTEPLELSALERERFISLAGSRAFRALCDALCDKAGFSYRPSFESDNPQVVKKMIGLGLGVGFWPQRSWGTLDGTGARMAELAEPGFERSIAVVRTKKNPTPEAMGFCELLVAYLARIWSGDITA